MRDGMVFLIELFDFKKNLHKNPQVFQLCFTFILSIGKSICFLGLPNCLILGRQATDKHFVLIHCIYTIFCLPTKAKNTTAEKQPNTETTIAVSVVTCCFLHLSLSPSPRKIDTGLLLTSTTCVCVFECVHI